MTNKVIKWERKHENTHTLVLTLETSVGSFFCPEFLGNKLVEVWENWDYHENVFCFYEIPDDLEDTFKEKLTEILEKYA